MGIQGIEQRPQQNIQQPPFNEFPYFIPGIHTRLDIQNGSDYQKTKNKLMDHGSLSDYITFFDTFTYEEGLPQNWQSLKSLKGRQVGFSMKTQMDLLDDPKNLQKLKRWTQKTKQDIIGFKLEYLTDHLVYPIIYEKNLHDPTRLENKLYGNADIEETVSEMERNGSVKKAIKRIKHFFLSPQTPEGSLAVMTSTKGDTGLVTDDGENISYPDSYFFILQKKNGKVINYTVKTDFSLNHCREAIEKLTGRKLSNNLSLEDYIDNLALITKDSQKEVQNPSDVIGVLEKIKPAYAFQDIGWKNVYEDIQQAMNLYNFNQKTQDIISEFEAYALEGTHTRNELQKAVAATILRIGKQYFHEDRMVAKEIAMDRNQWITIADTKSKTFGRIMEQVAILPGCAGGGKITSITTFGGNRLVSQDKKQEWFECGKCSYKATGPIGDGPCPGCGVTKEEYAKQTGQPICV